MESYRQRMGQLDEFARAGPIHPALFIQQAQHHAVRAQLTCVHDLLLHHLKFEIGVAEVAASRPNHDKQPIANMAPNRGNQSRAGSKAPLKQIAAEFNALSAPALCGNGRLH